MKRNFALATLLAAIGISAPAMSFAESHSKKEDMTEQQMLQSAKISLARATEIAKKELPGTLASIGLEDENGKVMYEAKVVGTDGAVSFVKIDAGTGAVLSKGLASADDEGQDTGDEDTENGENDNG
ncbi:MAG: PepSY domain-containing protein [Albidovulum sp.]